METAGRMIGSDHAEPLPDPPFARSEDLGYGSRELCKSPDHYIRPSGERAPGYSAAMRVTASEETTRFVAWRGGRLFVWADGKACCGGTRFIESSLIEPPDLSRFRTLKGPGFDVLLRLASGQLHDELLVEVKGRRRPRVAAYWNGCAYLVG